MQLYLKRPKRLKWFENFVKTWSNRLKKIKKWIVGLIDLKKNN